MYLPSVLWHILLVCRLHHRHGDFVIYFVTEKTKNSVEKRDAWRVSTMMTAFCAGRDNPFLPHEEYYLKVSESRLSISVDDSFALRRFSRRSKTSKLWKLRIPWGPKSISLIIMS
jgi:hypothetical protein